MEILLFQNAYQILLIMYSSNHEVFAAFYKSKSVFQNKIGKIIIVQKHLHVTVNCTEMGKIFI